MNDLASSDDLHLAPELRLLLCCGRPARDPGKQAAVRTLLAEDVDWTLFARLAVAHGMTSLAADALLALSPDDVPSELLDAFRALVDETARSSRRLFQELVRLLDALRQRGIEAIPFKGPILALQAFGGPRLREFNDLDFLVRDADLAATIATLRELGYPRTGNLTEAQFHLIHRLQGQEIIFGAASRIAVEPHTRLTPMKLALDIDYPALWRRARRSTLEGHTFLTLAPEDTLLLLAIHGGKEMWGKVKWTCDVAWFLAAHPALDWVAAMHRGRAQGCFRMLLLAAALARKYFHATLPPAMIAAEEADPFVAQLVRQIAEQWQDDAPVHAPSNNSISPQRLRLHDGIVRQMRYVTRTLLLPGPHHVASIPLPRALQSLYVPIKLSHDLMALPAWQACRRALAPLGHLPYRLAGSGVALALLPASAETKRTVRQLHRSCVDARRILAANPADPVAWRNLGDGLLGLRRFRGAVECYDKALSLAPRDVTVWKRRLTALGELGVMVDVAPDAPQDPNDARQWSTYAARLFSSRRYVQAIEASDRALMLAPDDIAAARVGIHARLRACDWRRRAADEQLVTEQVNAGQLIVSSFYHRCMSDSEADSLRLSRTATRGIRPNPPLCCGPPYRHHKIRVAYCSSEFRDHVIADVLVGCLEHHDRSRFHITAVSLGPDDGSAMRKRVEAAVDRFIDVRAMGDYQVARLLHEQEIDLLIDLNGHSGDTRTGIFSHRPGAVQVNFLGYPGTMGLACYDYIIADPIIIPENHRVHYTEQVVSLPHTYMPNDRTRRIADATLTRADAGLPPGGFVFACHNTDCKITPEMFAIWMRLLRDIDSSILWLAALNPAAIVNLRREAAERGVAPDRLVFAPRLPRIEEHLARLRLADLCLDTRPYNAHASACDALWAGVPLVTCPGNSFASRVAASVLQAVGMPELITASLDDYHTLAAALARDPERLAAIKAKLARNRDTEPLFDTARFTRDLEAAYSTMWRRHQDGLPPTSFAVAQAPAYAL